VVDMNLAYNIIIRKPLLHKINVIINTRYLVLKFPTLKEVTIMKGNQGASRHYGSTCLKSKKFLVFDQKGSLKEMLEIITKAI